MAAKSSRHTSVCVKDEPDTLITKQFERGKSKPKMPSEKFCGYRSNLFALCNFFEKYTINKDVIEILKNTPFWLMIEPFANNTTFKYDVTKNNTTVTRLIEHYSKKSSGFAIGSTILKLTRMDVILSLGIVCGTKPIVLPSATKKPDHRLVRFFPGKGKVTSHEILRALDQATVSIKTKEDAQDVAMLILLHIFASILFPSTRSYVTWGQISYVFDLEGLKEWDWATQVLEYLQKHLDKMRHAQACSGCVLLVMYLFCEHIPQIVATRPGMFPRFLKWNLQQVSRDLYKMDFHKLSSSEVITGPLVPTEIEAMVLIKDRDREKGFGGLVAEDLDFGVQTPLENLTAIEDWNSEEEASPKKKIKKNPEEERRNKRKPDDASRLTPKAWAPLLSKRNGEAVVWNESVRCSETAYGVCQALWLPADVAEFKEKDIKEKGCAHEQAITYMAMGMQYHMATMIKLDQAEMRVVEALKAKDEALKAKDDALKDLDLAQVKLGALASKLENLEAELLRMNHSKKAASTPQLNNNVFKLGGETVLSESPSLPNIKDEPKVDS